MLTDHRQGGVSYIGRGMFFPLEYVSDKPILVLNGILRCLLILRECGIRLNDPNLSSAYERGYESLKSRLEIFDAGYYTFYDSLGTPADRKYHGLHVELLRLIYDRNRDRDLLPILGRWTRYKRTYPIVEPIAFLRHLVRTKGRL
jgi:heparosan-N-sulfate-glucuronate 5-epimerase